MISAFTSSRHCRSKTSISVRCCIISACCCFRERAFFLSASTIRFRCVIASRYLTSRSYCLLCVCWRRACLNLLLRKRFSVRFVHRSCPYLSLLTGGSGNTCSCSILHLSLQSRVLLLG